jgi:hypothetical protein
LNSLFAGNTSENGKAIHVPGLWNLPLPAILSDISFRTDLDCLRSRSNTIYSLGCYGPSPIRGYGLNDFVWTFRGTIH